MLSSAGSIAGKAFGVEIMALETVTSSSFIFRRDCGFAEATGDRFAGVVSLPLGVLMVC